MSAMTANELAKMDSCEFEQLLFGKEQMETTNDLPFVNLDVDEGDLLLAFQLQEMQNLTNPPMFGLNPPPSSSCYGGEIPAVDGVTVCHETLDAAEQGIAPPPTTAPPPPPPLSCDGLLIGEPAALASATVADACGAPASSPFGAGFPPPSRHFAPKSPFAFPLSAVCPTSTGGVVSRAGASAASRMMARLHLSDEEIATMSFTDLCHSMSAVGMTETEMQEVKSLRRRLKNRHSARICSNRKRERCGVVESTNQILLEQSASMERRNTVLTEENEQLVSRCAELTQVSACLSEENTHLRNEVSRLTQLLAQLTTAGSAA